MNFIANNVERQRCTIMNFMELRLGLMGAFGGKFRIPEQNSSMFLIDMEVGHTYEFGILY